MDPDLWITEAMHEHKSAVDCDLALKGLGGSDPKLGETTTGLERRPTTSCIGNA